MIDLLPDRDPATVEAWLRRHPQVQVVARDRNGGYGGAVTRALPDAIQVADRWHLLENAGAAFLAAVRTAMPDIRKALSTQRLDPAVLTGSRASAVRSVPAPPADERPVRRMAGKGVPLKRIVRLTGLSCKFVRQILRDEREDVCKREAPDPATPMPNFEGLATDLAAAWSAPGVTTRSRQQLIRALISDIIADVDDATREVVLTIHWRGGQHSQLRVRKPKTGEHGCQTPKQALAVMERMATRFSDADIAATLNRMGLRTGQYKTWTVHRVASIRRVRGIHAYRSAEMGWMPLSPQRRRNAPSL